MPIIPFNNNMNDIKAFGHDVTKVMAFGHQVWQKQSSIPDYLCFTALEAGQFTLTIKASVGVGNLRYIEWSKDGKTWNHEDNKASTEIAVPVSVDAGDKVYWRGQGVNMTASSAAIANCSQFSSTARFDVSGHIMSLLKGDDFLNYQHLTNYDTDGVRNVTFTYLFYGCTTLVNAKDLILPTFTSYHTYIFSWMFRGCTALVSAPALPSLASASYCYYQMFYSCSSLTQAPSTIAATQLETQSCRSMFQGCTSLVTAPSIAATILNGTGELYQTFQGCTALVTPPQHLYPSILNSVSYYQTFQGCNHMTTMPTLHFTSLASNANHACYQMFSGCSLMEGEVAIDVPHAPHHAFCGMFGSCKITKAYVRCPSADQGAFTQTFFNMPTLADIDIVGATTLGGTKVYLSCFYGCRATRQSIILPATTLTDECYKQMFYTNGGTINHITCLATDISATDCTLNWLVSASSTGTFIQADGVTWPRGASGIPTGWVDIEKRTMPSGYKQLLWVSTDSKAYVNTGIAGDNDNLKITTVFNMSAYVDWGAIYGNYVGDSYNVTRLVQGSSDACSCCNLNVKSNNRGNQLDYNVFHINRPHMVIQSKNSVIYDGTTINISGKASGTANSGHIALGNRSMTNPNTTRNIGLCIYTHKIEDTSLSSVLCDYVACVRESDSKAGFYDFVSNAFIPSATSSDFTAGEEI